MAPGANYMGGKRNAARARNKDSTGRTQKNHFSRQRLEILSKGLSGRAGSRNSSGHGPRAHASDIELSHARHHVSWLDGSNGPTTRPRSPQRKTRNRNTSHQSSSGSRTSKVLEKLDTTEPLSMQAARDKILAIPDLAGLSAFRNVEPQTPPPRITGSKRSRSSDPEMLDREATETKRRRIGAARFTSSPDIAQKDTNFEELDYEYSDTTVECDSRFFDNENALHQAAGIYFCGG
ncbi:hypothetical protein R3P38DRAFT_771414 [Favolaschia claudopus]|uniref:Uncharacterized protein n=1 Tax=Favolaschia claudopus TaxID=2862362 RepID=A0AAW0C0J3_9AGAR